MIVPVHISGKVISYSLVGGLNGRLWVVLMGGKGLLLCYLNPQLCVN